MNNLEQSLWNGEVLPLKVDESVYKWAGNLSEPFLLRLSEEDGLLFDTIEYVVERQDVPYGVIYSILARELSRWVSPITSSGIEQRYFNNFSDDF